MRKRRVFDEVSLWALVFLSHSIGSRKGTETQKKPLQSKDLFFGADRDRRDYTFFLL